MNKHYATMIVIVLSAGLTWMGINYMREVYWAQGYAKAMKLVDEHREYENKLIDFCREFSGDDCKRLVGDIKKWKIVE